MRGGPRKKTRFPAASGYGSVRIVPAKVQSVDKVKHTCTVHGMYDNEVYEGVAVMAKFLNAGDGTGSWTSPEVNTVVWLCTPSSDSNPFILGWAQVPFQDEADDNADPNDYRMNRPVLNEGDEMIASRDSGYIIIRKGGIVEIAGSQMARTFYIPIENIVQTFAENYKIETPGMEFSALVRDEDESRGVDVSPFEVKLIIKEFANDTAPMIDMRFGRIAAEEDTFVPLGGGIGDIVARLIINQAYKVFVDKSGNISTTIIGNELRTVDKLALHHYEKNLIHRVKGLFRHVGKDRSVELRGVDNLAVGGNRTVEIKGAVTETIDGSVKRVIGGTLTEEVGEVTRDIKGPKNETVLASLNQVVAGGHALKVGENLDMTVGGKTLITVGNAQAESAGFQILLANGELNIVDVTGSIIFAAGGLPSIAVSTISIGPTGTIEISSGLGQITYEQNLTGARIKTPAGEITIDNAGSVHLGPAGEGAVVTTLTHPVDYITGLPILGSSSVGAGGAPSVAPLPRAFIPA